MGFWTVKFKEFDPISGDVPDSPFSYLPDIAWKARRLLNKRTFQQFLLIVESVDWAINLYFDELMDKEYERLRKERGWNINDIGIAYFEPYFIDEDGFENDSIDPKNPPKELVYGGKHTDPENGNFLNWFYVEPGDIIPTAANSSELDALKECAEYFDEICIVNGAKDVRPYELFAALTLCLIADAIYVDLPNTLKLELPELWFEINGVRTTFRLTNFAADYAMKAMEAICYSEHLYETEKIKIIHQFELNKTHDVYLQEKSKQEEEERNRRKERSEQLNQQRHKKRNKAKAMVIAEWLKQPDKFPSGEQAGLYFADWLQKQGTEFQPRSVTSWIREAAKERGIRFR